MITKPVSTPTLPTHFQGVPGASTRNAPAVFALADLPMINSLIITGIPKNSMQAIYTKIKI